jgi:lipoate-protein ligase A
MIKRLQFYLSDTVDPHINLAKEKILFDAVDDETIILYLWQNQNTVVIGKNQNAFSECRTELLREEGGRLARRLSGGGAVFHDLGNLNFTFICATQNLDISKHMQVIKTACAHAGIATELSGRNDILACGRKFSGNAFYNSKGHSYHHGTILISADTEKMGRYLTPPKAKLEAKGVKSVRSRVINLSELAPALTCEAMKAHLLLAFEEVYESKPEAFAQIEEEYIAELSRDYGSWEYLYGTPIPFNALCEGRLSFGSAEIQMRVENGIVVSLKFYTDALDSELSKAVEGALVSIPFELSDIREALIKVLPKEETDELISLLSEQIFS